MNKILTIIVLVFPTLVFASNSFVFPEPVIEFDSSKYPGRDTDPQVRRREIADFIREYYSEYQKQFLRKNKLSENHFNKGQIEIIIKGAISLPDQVILKSTKADISKLIAEFNNIAIHAYSKPVAHTPLPGTGTSAVEMRTNNFQATPTAESAMTTLPNLLPTEPSEHRRTLEELEENLKTVSSSVLEQNKLISELKSEVDRMNLNADPPPSRFSKELIFSMAALLISLWTVFTHKK